MSIDFFANIKVESGFDYYRSTCPVCKGRHRFAPDESIGPMPDANCRECYGDGADWKAGEAASAEAEAKRGGFNVSNDNGFWILREILGIVQPDYCGSIDPATVLVRLASFSPVEAAAGVRAPRTERGVVVTAEGVSDGATVHDFGRTSNQVEGYLGKLRRCAEIAQANGVEIVWS